MKPGKVTAAENLARKMHTQRERAERAELALLKIGMATNERKTYEAVAAFFNVKVGHLWTLAKKRGVA